MIKQSRKILSLRPEFKEAILSGQKTQTRRLDKWFDVGDIITTKEGRTGKAFARIEVVGFRRERLHEITVDGAIREGYECSNIKTIDYFLAYYDINPRALNWFIELWNFINKKPGTRWEDDPIVSVIEFRVVEGAR